MKAKYYLTCAAAISMAVACNKSPESEIQPVSLTDSTSMVDGDDEDADIDDIAFLPWICLDSPPDEPEQGRGLQTDAVLVKDYRWPNGKLLRIFFMNGGDYLQGKVMKYARVWAKHANVGFVRTDDKEKSDIRVGFKIGNDQSSWSSIGTYANQRKGKQTMNFGWFDSETEEKEFSRTITHEFGHALGLGHEQLSPDEKINWNKPKVYKYYKKHFGWNKERVDQNIFNKYQPADVRNTPFDKKSIMQYPVDPKLTTDGRGIGYNYYLSDKDKSFIGRVYPN